MKKFNKYGFDPLVLAILITIIALVIRLCQLMGLGSAIDKVAADIKSWVQYETAVANARKPKLDFYRKLSAIRIAEANQVQQYLIERQADTDWPECTEAIRRVWVEEFEQANLALFEYQRKANRWNAYAYRALGVLGGDPSAYSIYKSLSHDTSGLEELKTYPETETGPKT